MSSIPVKAKRDFTIANIALPGLGAVTPAGLGLALNAAGVPVSDALMAAGGGGFLLTLASCVAPEGKKGAFFSGAIPGTAALLTGPVVAWAGEGMMNEGMNLMSQFKGACAATSCALAGGTAAFAGAVGEKWKEKKKAFLGALAGGVGAIVLSTALTFGEDIVPSPAPEITNKPITVRMVPVASSLANRIPG
jgi:hypothetical protein